MTRETYISRPDHPMADEFGMVPKRLAKFTEVRSGIHVISDVMPPTKHMGTGRMHDSKSRFRADTRASGCVEVGNDPAASRRSPQFEPTMRDVVGDVKRSLQELNSR